MLHDDKTYKDPMVFNPDRFLSALPEKDPRDCAFGFGRRFVHQYFVLYEVPSLTTLSNRICPGINVAIAEVYLSIVQTLAMFKISKALDADGKEIDVDFEYSSGTVR
jgi:cytochrome P450